MAKKRPRVVIEIEGEKGGLHASHLLRVLHEAIRVLHDAEAMGKGRGKPIRWIVGKMSTSSPHTVELLARDDVERADRILKGAFRGFSALKRNGKRPACFSDEGLDSIGDMVTPLGKGVKRIQLRHLNKSFSPTPETREKIEKIKKSLDSQAYADQATLEGTVEATDIHRTPHFRIYDVATEHPVKCGFGRELFEQVRAALDRRALVTGIARYNNNHKIMSFRATDIEVIDDDNLPQFRAGEEVDITGGEDPVDYVRRFRDAF